MKPTLDELEQLEERELPSGVTPAHHHPAEARPIEPVHITVDDNGSTGEKAFTGTHASIDTETSDAVFSPQHQHGGHAVHPISPEVSDAIFSIVPHAPAAHPHAPTHPKSPHHEKSPPPHSEPPEGSGAPGSGRAKNPPTLGHHTKALHGLGKGQSHRPKESHGRTEHQRFSRHGAGGGGDYEANPRKKKHKRPWFIPQVIEIKEDGNIFVTLFDHKTQELLPSHAIALLMPEAGKHLTFKVPDEAQKITLITAADGKSFRLEVTAHGVAESYAVEIKGPAVTPQQVYVQNQRGESVDMTVVIEKAAGKER